MPLDIIVGSQWGDEGKGRVVDLLSARADYVARYNGGDNAGHTVTVGSSTFRLHLIPSGIIHPHTTGLIGNGLVVNPDTLLVEMHSLESSGIRVTPVRLRISYAAHVLTPAHRALDAAQEAARGTAAIGTTLRGIGPAYTDKVSRSGIRMGEMLDVESFADAVEEHVKTINTQIAKIYDAEPLDARAVVMQLSEQARLLRPYIADVSGLLAGALARGERVLAEGAQGTLLDLDHGSYPFVTSSNPTAAGALIGLGVGVGCVERIIGVTKAFQTRVGAGPFPSEVSGEVADHLRGTGEHPWDEFGTTTGRPRRVGWLDLVLLRYATRINGFTELTITKLDILTGLHPLKIVLAYRHNGQTINELPFGPGELSKFEPVYEEMAGWQQDLGSVRRWEQLPPQARAYILRIEELCGVPVRLISVGPERDQVIEIE
ncbi:MAG TPA: adenylosuccinate synthase [Anaerolineales bacterium]|nr:adenylosuccinate synthase [Anaerolineales bacterium]